MSFQTMNKRDSVIMFHAKEFKKRSKKVSIVVGLRGFKPRKSMQLRSKAQSKKMRLQQYDKNLQRRRVFVRVFLKGFLCVKGGEAAKNQQHRKRKPVLLPSSPKTQTHHSEKHKINGRDIPKKLLPQKEVTGQLTRSISFEEKIGGKT